jgi:hypothetical protein
VLSIPFVPLIDILWVRLAMRGHAHDEVFLESTILLFIFNTYVSVVLRLIRVVPPHVLRSTQQAARL